VERRRSQRDPEDQASPKGTHANSTLATNGRQIVAMFGSEGLFAYDTRGTLLWKKDLGLLESSYFQVPEAQWGFASSPVIHGDRVIVQADVLKGSFLAAFDIATGRELWRTERTTTRRGALRPCIRRTAAPGDRERVQARWRLRPDHRERTVEG
jgi:outer membrane protein assembly factor BamB